MQLRTREDLQYFAVSGHRLPTWVVRDPLTLSCFRLGSEEYFLLTRLNMVSRLAELREQFNARFAPRILSEAELQGLLVDWLQKGLLLAGPSLLTHLRRQLGPAPGAAPRSFWQEWLGNPLVIRFRGWDPRSFLDHITPPLGFLFRPEVWLSCLLVGCLAAAVALRNFPRLLQEVTSLPTAFAPAEWLIVLVVLVGAKVLHEFGHALTCHHYGGKCHEMGVMLLAFIPCLYCNVTDAWTFRSQGARVAVSGAGICVDLTIAAVALLLWHFSAPGLFHDVCLLLAVAGSVNSLLLNGNPLMRYDGYYICSDLLGRPNLRSEAMQQGRRLFFRLLMGREPSPGAGPVAWGLAGYGWMSGLYLLLVLLVILAGVYQFLRPWGAENLAVAAGFVLFPAQLSQSGRRLLRSGKQAYRDRGQPRQRLRLGLIFLAVIVGTVLFLPFPRRVPATGILMPARKESLVAVEEGLLATLAKPGQAVTGGQRLAELRQPAIEQQLLALATRQQATIALRLAIEKKRTQLADSTEMLTVLSERLQALTEQQSRLQTRRDQLQLTSATAGWLIPALPENTSDRTFFPPGAGVDPFARDNVGMRIDAGTSLGNIVDWRQYELTVLLEDHWGEKVRPGAALLVELPEEPGVWRRGEILELAPAAEDPRGRQRDSGTRAEVAVRKFLEQQPRSQSTTWVTARAGLLPDRPGQWQAYQICRLRIDVPPASLWDRFREFLHRTWRESTL